MFFRYKEDIVGGLEEINQVVRYIVEKTEYMIDDEDISFDLRVILNELLINAYEHGNKEDKDKTLNLDLVINDIELKLKVKDQGDGIYEKDYHYNCKDLLNHGRGLQLVSKLSDCFYVEKNIVRCILYIK